MKHTESHFGLIVDREADSLSANNGKTWYKRPLCTAAASHLQEDIEDYLDRPMTEEESADLQEICQ